MPYWHKASILIGMAKEKQTAPVGKLGKMKAFIFLVTYKFIWCKIINLQAARLLILQAEDY